MRGDADVCCATGTAAAVAVQLWDLCQRALQGAERARLLLLSVSVTLD